MAYSPKRYPQIISGAGAVLLLLGELDKAQKESMCFSALGIAFVLPDMCAKLEYGGNTKSEEYKKWVDKYVCPLIYPDEIHSPYTLYGDGNGHYSLQPDETYTRPIRLFTGETIYRLRCSFFHEGIPNIINPRNKEDLMSKIEFKLILEHDGISCGEIGVTYSPKQFNCEEKTTISFGLPAQEICNNIRMAVKNYYEQNREKFKHLTFSVKDTRPYTRSFMGIE